MIVEESNGRLFVSPTFGCSGGCLYCYLANIDKDKLMDVKCLDEYLACSPVFKTGKQGTVFSLGCYSDPFTEENISLTLDVLETLLEYSNYIQIATKFVVPNEVQKLILRSRKHEYHVLIYFSCPTVSQDALLEPNCPRAIDRIKNMDKLQREGVPSVLYIKPFIEGVTIRDRDIFKRVSSSEIPIVLGLQYNVADSLKNSRASIGNGLLEVVSPTNDYLRLIEYLSETTQVYKHSIEVIDHIRTKELEHGYKRA